MVLGKTIGSALGMMGKNPRTGGGLKIDPNFNANKGRPYRNTIEQLQQMQQSGQQLTPFQQGRLDNVATQQQPEPVYPQGMDQSAPFNPQFPPGVRPTFPRDNMTNWPDQRMQQNLPPEMLARLNQGNLPQLNQREMANERYQNALAQMKMNQMRMQNQGMDQMDMQKQNMSQMNMPSLPPSMYKKYNG